MESQHVFEIRGLQRSLDILISSSKYTRGACGERELLLTLRLLQYLHAIAVLCLGAD